MTAHMKTPHAELLPYDPNLKTLAIEKIHMTSFFGNFT
jgi:hypothetical protein